LILVDTKYEFRKVGDTLCVIDEIHTPDSSRYWHAASYAERLATGQDQDMLDKGDGPAVAHPRDGLQQPWPLASHPEEVRLPHREVPSAPTPG
jgi:phosphoribosylaminoimidazole-succinocarboxamide synthase